MLHFLSNLPYAWLFTAVVIGAIGMAIYAHDLWPIPGDAALVVLAHTGWFGLFVAVALFCARRWPAWCDDVAQAWPQLAMRTLLPGMATRTPTRTPTKRAQPAATGSTHRLSEREWLDWCNNRDDAPHLVATGASGAGKTLLATVVLSERAGQIIVCTPKPAHLDPWGGIDAVRLGTVNNQISYRPMVDAVKAVFQEMSARYAAGVIDPEPITLVIDEFSDVIYEEPDIKAMVLRMWALARAAKIRLITISTEVNVKAWGIEGRGDARQNLVFIKTAVDAQGARSASMARWGETPQPIDIRNVKRRADAVDLSARGWVPSPSSAGQQTQPLATVVAQPAPHSGKRPISDAELSKFKRSKVFTRQDVHDMGYEFRDERWTAA